MLQNARVTAFTVSHLLSKNQQRGGGRGGGRGELELKAADFFDLDRLFVKGKMPECSPTLTLKWRQVSP